MALLLSRTHNLAREPAKEKMIAMRALALLSNAGCDRALRKLLRVTGGAFLMEKLSWVIADEKSPQGREGRWWKGISDKGNCIHTDLQERDMILYENQKQFSGTGVLGMGGSGPRRRQGRWAGVRSGRPSDKEYHAQEFGFHPWGLRGRWTILSRAAVSPNLGFRTFVPQEVLRTKRDRTIS